MVKSLRTTEEAPPTMIIPRGTEISVDVHGQLSVRAPGNLVIQHSGQYGNLESVAGSIRIEPGVEVEAVSVACSETCYVQGSLTAWRVAAKNLQLEDTARAHIVLQETERLEVGKGARLVGNFSSEKELFFLFSRFSRQVRSLPVYRDRDVETPAAELVQPFLGAAPLEPEPALPPASGRSAVASLPEPLFFAMALLERELGAGNPGPEVKRVLRELLKLLAEGDLETLRHTWRTLFGRVKAAGDGVERARELVEGHFARPGRETGAAVRS